MAQVTFKPPIPLPAGTTSFNWSTSSNWTPNPPNPGDSVGFINPGGLSPNHYTSVIDPAFTANLSLASLALQLNVTLDVQQSESFTSISGSQSTDGSANRNGLILVGNGASLTDGAISPNQTIYLGYDGTGATGTFDILGNIAGPVTTITLNRVNLDLGAGQNDGDIILQNSTFDSTDAASSNAVWTGGTLTLGGGSTANLSGANYVLNANSSPGILSFVGSNNEVILPPDASDSNYFTSDALTISDLGFTDKIELSGLPAGTTIGSAIYHATTKGAMGSTDELDIYSGPRNTGTLIAGLQGVTIDPSTGLNGDIPASEFMVGTDATGSYIELACFAAGTRIETRQGDIRVELLREGDEIVTYRGPLAELATAPVKWIGRRRVDIAHHPAPALVRPVRIEVGAFAEGVPAHPLRVSPEHALFFDGVLIPARYLINGSSIVQEDVTEVTYYHIELPQHDVLLAEGVPAESWLDTGNRSAFENGGAVVSLVPDFRVSADDSWSKSACAPLVEDGPVLQRLRAVVAARALELGLSGRAIQNVVLAPNTEVSVTIALGTRIMRLVSAVTQAPGDVRRLGAVIQSMVVDDVAIALDGASIGPGFYELERDGESVWRWTDGDGLVFIDHRDAGKTLKVRVGLCAAVSELPHVRSRVAGMWSHGLPGNDRLDTYQRPSPLAA